MDEEEFEQIMEQYTDKVDRDLTAAMVRFSDNFGFDPKETTLTSGKHLRGVLTHIVAHAIDEARCNEMTNNMAVMVEMLHQFTLVHDDIMDDDDIRRGRPSLWKMMGIGKTILIGDAGLAHVVSLSSAMSGMKAVQVLATTLMALARGVVYEFSDIVSDRTSAQIESKLIQIMELKTSALFAMAGQFGAISVNAGPFYEKAGMAYGKGIGVLLQFVDDYVDIMKAVIKDEEGGDIKFNRITLPMLIFAQESGDDGMKAALQYATKEIPFSELKTHIDFQEGNGAVMRRIESLKEAAKKEAEAFPKSEFRDVMLHLPDYIVEVMLDEL